MSELSEDRLAEVLKKFGQGYIVQEVPDLADEIRRLRAAASAPRPDVETLLKPFEEMCATRKHLADIEALRAALEPMARLEAWVREKGDGGNVPIGMFGGKLDVSLTWPFDEEIMDADGTGPTLPEAVKAALDRAEGK